MASDPGARPTTSTLLAGATGLVGRALLDRLWAPADSATSASSRASP